MANEFYGAVPQTIINSPLEAHLEELAILGFTVIEDVYPATELAALRAALDDVYDVQRQETEPEFSLESIQEENQVRAPLCYDERFLDIARNPRIVEIVQRTVGKYFLIQLQIGIINAPQMPNRQATWHRDLLYQDFVASKPLAVSAMLCLDDFNETTGGTMVIPGSHKVDRMPSAQFLEKSAVTIRAKAGSMFVMDSMAIHRAGHNASSGVRRGLNTIYACGLFKQQVSLKSQMKGAHREDPFLNILLGYDAETSESVLAWRKRRHEKLKR